MTEIFVNAKKIYWSRKLITYSELVIIAGYFSDETLTVQFSKGESDDFGTMIYGHDREIIDGMVFDVVMTNNA